MFKPELSPSALSNVVELVSMTEGMGDTERAHAIENLRDGLVKRGFGYFEARQIISGAVEIRLRQRQLIDAELQSMLDGGQNA